MTDLADLADLTALELRERVARGKVRAADVSEACLRRIDALDREVAAFVHLDAAGVRTRAKACDDERDAGRPIGALHGLPVAVKDIIDTADLPTENGTPLDAGRRPAKDATVVQRLRGAGAVVLGKTVTTELGSMHPRETRNPRDLQRTPGGSSSGSAAAVAAGMVPLAIGTQTNGSVIRPASFCGVVGFKPTFGLIPRAGILGQARPLDTVGVFARTVADAALLAETIAGRDPGDAATKDVAPPRLLDAVRAGLPAEPRLAFVKSPSWELAEAETRSGLADLARSLGPACAEVRLPDMFAGGVAAQATLAFAGIAHLYRPYYERGREQLSPWMQKAIEDGGRITAVEYVAALDLRERLNAALEDVFARHDAIVTPAAPGEAPPGIAATGNPVFNSLWSLCGVPAVSLPLMTGANGLPIGVQLVGRHGDDAHLLAVAAWLAATVGRSL